MRTTLLLTGMLALLLAGCDQPREEEQRDTQAKQVQPPAEQSALQRWYEQRSSEQLRTLEIRARTFRDSVRGLLQAPDEQRLATARETWRGLNEAFYGAFVPLHALAQREPAMAERLQRANPVPVFPGYIDGLAQWPDSGIVNDRTVAMTEQSLLAQQGATADGEVSLGLQVVHFLLHGEPDQPRTAAAFDALSTVPDDRILLPDEVRPVQRRRDYLHLSTDIVTRDLEILANAGTVPSGSRALVKSLQQLTRELISLEGLGDADQVAGEYMAPETRRQGMDTLLASLRNWLAADTPLMEELAEREVASGTLREKVSGIDNAGDVKSLQALHAELAAIAGQLDTP